MEIHRLKGVEEVKKEAAKKISRLLQTYERQDVLFLTSGGSARAVLDLVDITDARQLTVGVLDERWSQEREINNFFMLSETQFFSRAKKCGVHVLESIPRDNETLEEFGDRFERQLRNWRLAHKNGIIIVTLGMGIDGHTAGIFPYPDLPEMFKESFIADSWVHAYNAVGKHVHEDRVTPTITFLQEQVAHAIVYITGKEKQDALVKVMEGKGSLAETPARVFRAMKHVYLYTDN